jgi:hypothetical protein
VEDGTVCGSDLGDCLLVHGAVKDLSSIDEKSISAGFAQLEFADMGPSSSDPVLREAIAQFDEPSFRRLTGLSGSPVFNSTKKRLCGVAVRGGLNADMAIMRYTEMFDVVEVLTAIVDGTLKTQYAMSIAHPIPPA